MSATVVRDGEERVLTADDLVPGDLIALTAGDVVRPTAAWWSAPVSKWTILADGRVVTGDQDPAPVVASQLSPNARRWSTRAPPWRRAGPTAVVVAVGDDTEAGRSMAIAREAAPTRGESAGWPS